jgi:hypothetical protein
MELVYLVVVAGSTRRGDGTPIALTLRATSLYNKPVVLSYADCPISRTASRVSDSPVPAGFYARALLVD